MTLCHGRRSSKWFGGATNFCPKNDLMHGVSLSKLGQFYSAQIKVFSKKKKKKKKKKGLHRNWDGILALVRPNIQTICPNTLTICPNFRRFSTFWTEWGGDRPPCPPASYGYALCYQPASGYYCLCVILGSNQRKRGQAGLVSISKFSHSSTVNAYGNVDNYVTFRLNFIINIT